VERLQGGVAKLLVDELRKATKVGIALRALEALGRPSTSRDRRDLWKANGIPYRMSSFLARARAIAQPENKDTHAKPRIVTEKGKAWIGDPTQVLAAIEDASGYIASIHASLAEFAREERLPMGEHAHILHEKGLWPKNLWQPLESHRHRFPADADLHRWIHHLRSSQAFAFNLFGPLAVGWQWAQAVWEPAFGKVRAVSFEYPADGDPDGDDPLEECSPERPHRSRVDVRLDHGLNSTTLIEVKLTEPEFGTCSAAHDSANEFRETCTTPDLSLQEIADGCYLVRSAGRSYFRRIDGEGALLSAASLQELSDDGCPFRHGIYQLARNLMIAQHLRNGGIDVRFAVVAPGREMNPTLHGQRSLCGHPDLLSLLRSIVREEDQETVQFFEFTQVVDRAASLDASARSWADYMRRKYVLPLLRGAASVRRTPS
jgi:hypothetical protein